MATLGQLLLLTIASYPAVDAARILAFVPFPAKSHQRAIQPLFNELAVRGHQVICYSPYPLQNPHKNYQGVQLPDYMPQLKKSLTERKLSDKDLATQWKSDFSKMFLVFFKDIGVTFSEWVFKLEEVQRLIHSNQTFDAVILETTFLQENFIGFGHRFNAPVIEFSPTGNMLWTYWLHGTPADTSYIVDAFFAFTDHMSFTERLMNTVRTDLTKVVWYNYYMPKYQQVMDKYLRYEGWETRPSMMDMIANTSLLLINTHYSLNFPCAYAPHVKEIGGLNLVEPQPLPTDLQEFMDGAKDGVIYFTLGSHIQVTGVLGEELKEVFSQVFRELKQRVLWKWESDFPNLPSNIKISKWFPQQDILAHKNIKLFITHGGLLSTTEAVYQGVPTIGIPLMADQFRNVKYMERHNYGILLDLENITYSSLKWAINEILDHPSYGENAKKRSQMFRDKPETALETAVYWTEYVIRHKGAPHLRPSIATMPWYQQVMIDVYLTIALIMFIPLYICYRVTCCFCRLFCRLRTCRDDKQNSVSRRKQKTQ